MITLLQIVSSNSLVSKMCADSNVLTAAAAQEPFCKILKQLAEQLWQSKLQDTLQDALVLKHLTDEECSRISTYEQLFEHFITKKLVTPSNIAILKEVLRNHESKCGLLRAVYEAGFGREGLDSCSTEQSSYASLLKPTSGQTKAVRDFKTLLRRIDTQLESKEDLGALRLLCCSVLSFRQLDGFTSALDLCNALRRAKCISPQKPEFLYRLLKDCGRLDLCDLVNGYVYTCKTIPPDSPCPEPSERKNSDHRRKISYRFVQALKNLGDQLDSDDLAMMKLLAGTYIADSKLEKADNIYEFLILLQDRGKLEQKNITYLEQLLDDKLHVLNPLYDLGFGCRVQLPHKYHRSLVQESLMNFKRLLKNVGSRLSSENIYQLKHLCSNDTGSLTNVHSGIELLSLLEKRAEISPDNVGFLLELLQEVGRRDLGSIVSTYISQQQCTAAQGKVWFTI